MIFSSLADKLTSEQLLETIRINNLWGWISYLVLPVILYFKITVIAIAIFIAAFLSDNTISFKELCNIVIKAEFIFLLPIVFKTVWFYFFKSDYTLEELQNYMPLSLESLFGYKNFEPWYIYPMQVANLFEVAYWIVLTFLLAKTIQTTKSKAFTLVVSSYGIGLFILVAGMMFLTLNIS